MQNNTIMLCSTNIDTEADVICIVNKRKSPLDVLLESSDEDTISVSPIVKKKNCSVPVDGDESINLIRRNQIQLKNLTVQNLYTMKSNSTLVKKSCCILTLLNY